MSAERHLRIPPFAKSAKDGAPDRLVTGVEPKSNSDLYPIRSTGDGGRTQSNSDLYSTRSTGDGGRAPKQFGPVSHPIDR